MKHDYAELFVGEDTMIGIRRSIALMLTVTLLLLMLPTCAGADQRPLVGVA